MIQTNRKWWTPAVFGALTLALSACGGGPIGRGMPPADREMMSGILAERAKLRAFDADADQQITSAELEKGLEATFAEFDLDKDGLLKALEVSRANDRLAAADETMPPLRDWNQSGAVEFDEFAAWTRGRFRRLDADQDGNVTQAELTALPKMNRRMTGSGPPGGRPPGGAPPEGGRPDRRLSQSVATPRTREY